jgi:uncharacterized protein (DUF2236 family)
MSGFEASGVDLLATLTARRPAAAAGFDARELADGAALLAATANVIMQLARPEVGYGVLEHSQVMRYPVRRLRDTVTYLSVALLGSDAERAVYRRLVGRCHAGVRSGAGSPVGYNAFDPGLQLWVAACLYRGVADVHALLYGPADDATADAIYRECSRLGTTLQVPPDMWPGDRAAFGRYWDSAVRGIRIDPPVRELLCRVMMLAFLPRPLSAALGPVNRFLTAGFLPPPFREQMRLDWTGHDQRRFEVLMRAIASIDRALPEPVSEFPFNACLQDLRARIACQRARRAVARRLACG